ncbi:protein N-lysine methyltransferase METTL21A isoform X1 [Tanacetum coccineum]|uniref:Protein N-lysine methyltransferase METTL21A isoform X1 n=1 Tax=Tanacetum coccineum TaxID=301880 RepID=A0ABQ5I866_9ASTR
MSENNVVLNNKPNDGDSDDDDTVCLGESFFMNDNYELTTFTFGSHVLHLLCLQSASMKRLVSASIATVLLSSSLNPSRVRVRASFHSFNWLAFPSPKTVPASLFYFVLVNARLLFCGAADFDLTGQLVWPGARLLNEYISNNVEILQGCSAVELGSGIGITGILCSRFCREVVLTDHNDEILKKNIELHESSENPNSCAALSAEKLEWGNSDHLNQILEKHPEGFDLQNSVPPLFDSVKELLSRRGKERCRFILAYISRSKMMDIMVTKEAIQHGLQIHEVDGTRSVIANHEGVIYEITL